MHAYENGLARLRSRAEWLAHLDACADALRGQQVLLHELAAREDRQWPARCSLCQGMQAFSLPDAGPEGGLDLRETLSCPGCGLNARVRAALGLLQAGIASPSARIYLTEQASLAFAWLKRRYPGTCGSEYRLDPVKRARLEHWLGELGVPGPIDHGDIMDLHFADAGLDAIASFDVLEHVPDHRAALREFARCLRPGGRLVLTAPFLDDREQSLVRARLREDGSIEHLLPPEIHGDPISGGALCFCIFGWELLEQARDAGFSDVAWCRHWHPGEAYFGLWTLVATR